MQIHMCNYSIDYILGGPCNFNGDLFIEKVNPYQSRVASYIPPYVDIYLKIEEDEENEG